MYFFSEGTSWLNGRMEYSSSPLCYQVCLDLIALLLFCWFLFGPLLGLFLGTKWNSGFTNLPQPRFTKFGEFKKSETIETQVSKQLTASLWMTRPQFDSYCWWFRNLTNQLILYIVYPIIHRVLHLPGGWEGDFWTINQSFETSLRLRTSQLQRPWVFRVCCMMRVRHSLATWQRRGDVQVKLEEIRQVFSTRNHGDFVGFSYGFFFLVEKKRFAHLLC